MASQRFCAPMEFIQLISQLLAAEYTVINMLLNEVAHVRAVYSMCLLIRCVIIKTWFVCEVMLVKINVTTVL